VLRVSHTRALRRVRAFMRRMAKRYGRALRWFAGFEDQRRGMTHPHMLVRALDRPAPWWDFDEIRQLWQYWQTWKRIDWCHGIEGRVETCIVRTPGQASYAAKHATKSGGEWVLEDTDGRRGQAELPWSCLVSRSA